MKRASIAAISFVALGLGFSIPAQGQSIQIGPGGVTVEPNYRGDRDRDRYRDRREYRGISSRDAARVARSNGMVNIRDVSERRGRYVVRGDDRRGRGMIVTVSSRTGDIIDVERERRW
ncbi:hypothetical protein GCM10007276_19800 [Agaricicola taiwanensis]|uniref:PepSY domain-containing protein n=1 Tax=Agaricicola taiwanensis TaxID=591372 RepID=A0A8J2W4A2_9RHOB|nr:PepSY domain-containing protein [Agaricicola taiwanensis]GGE42538.1 hypothetical protein GCM10007276_19800 [Agaricicola taiwanensis]